MGRKRRRRIQNGRLSTSRLLISTLAWQSAAWCHHGLLSVLTELYSWWFSVQMCSFLCVHVGTLLNLWVCIWACTCSCEVHAPSCHWPNPKMGVASNTWLLTRMEGALSQSPPSQREELPFIPKPSPFGRENVTCCVERVELNVSNHPLVNFQSPWTVCCMHQ